MKIISGVAKLASAWVVLLGASMAFADSSLYSPDAPCSPASEFLEVDGVQGGGMNPAFCAEWNPDFVWSGHRCCSKPPVPVRRRWRRVAARCSPERTKASFCDEMTPEQLRYTELVKSGRVDVLESIRSEIGKQGQQSYCGPSTGFLAYGRRLVPTEKNRIRLRYPERCTEFGTDGMIGMLEWMGRRIAERYPAAQKGRDPSSGRSEGGPGKAGAHPDVRLYVGNVSAPRGGCLTGLSGRRGHASHTNGQDVDLAFLELRRSFAQRIMFTSNFDVDANWWMVKQLFKNPYVCVKRVFVDRKLIGKLRRIADEDPEWETYRPFIQHVKGHRTHFHVRVGDRPGPPGCADPSELEPDEEETLPDDAPDFVINRPALKSVPSEPGRRVASEAPPR